LAIVIAAMSSSSPGRIGVSMATTSRPAGSRMKPEEARPTQVACVTRRVRCRAGTRRVDGVEGQHFLDAWVVSLIGTKEKVDFRAAQLAICSTSRPPPRTESAACFECRLCGRRSAAAGVEMARRAKSFIL
jgi:hypothetical protein